MFVLEAVPEIFDLLKRMCHKISPLYILMILIYTLLWPPDKKTGQSVVLGFDVVDIYLNYSENYQLCTYVKVFR